MRNIKAVLYISAKEREKKWKCLQLPGEKKYFLRNKK